MCFTFKNVAKSSLFTHMQFKFLYSFFLLAVMLIAVALLLFDRPSSVRVAAGDETEYLGALNPNSPLYRYYEDLISRWKRTGHKVTVSHEIVTSGGRSRTNVFWLHDGKFSNYSGLRKSAPEVPNVVLP